MLTSATVYLQDKAAVLAQQWCATMTKKYDDEQCVGRSLMSCGRGNSVGSSVFTPSLSRIACGQFGFCNVSAMHQQMSRVVQVPLNDAEIVI